MRGRSRRPMPCCALVWARCHLPPSPQRARHKALAPCRLPPATALRPATRPTRPRGARGWRAAPQAAAQATTLPCPLPPPHTPRRQCAWWWTCPTACPWTRPSRWSSSTRVSAPGEGAWVMRARPRAGGARLGGPAPARGPRGVRAPALLLLPLHAERQPSYVPPPAPQTPPSHVRSGRAGRARARGGHARRAGGGGGGGGRPARRAAGALCAQFYLQICLRFACAEQGRQLLRALAPKAPRPRLLQHVCAQRRLRAQRSLHPPPPPRRCWTSCCAAASAVRTRRRPDVAPRISPPAGPACPAPARPLPPPPALLTPPSHHPSPQRARTW